MKGALNILVLGKENVGKSAIVVRYLTGRYLTEYAHEPEMTYERTVVVEGKHVPLKITDISGKYIECRTGSKDLLAKVDGVVVVYSVSDQRSFELAEGYIECRTGSKDLLAKVDGVVVVYSVSDQRSFELAEGVCNWLRQDRKVTTNIPVVLLGNKADLAHMREVTSQLPAKLEWRADSYLATECSASTGSTEIVKVFNALIQKILEKKDMPIKQQRKLSQNPLGSPKVIRATLKRRFSVFTRERTSTM